MRDTLNFLVVEMDDGRISVSTVHPPEDEVYENFTRLPGSKTGRATLVKLSYSSDDKGVTAEVKTKLLPVSPDPQPAQKKIGEKL